MVVHSTRWWAVITTVHQEHATTPDSMERDGERWRDHIVVVQREAAPTPDAGEDVPSEMMDDSLD
jgi:hypothetical protein